MHGLPSSAQYLKWRISPHGLNIESSGNIKYPMICQWIHVFFFHWLIHGRKISNFSPGQMSERDTLKRVVHFSFEEFLQLDFRISHACTPKSSDIPPVKGFHGYTQEWLPPLFPKKVRSLPHPQKKGRFALIPFHELLESNDGYVLKIVRSFSTGR